MVTLAPERDVNVALGSSFSRRNPLTGEVETTAAAASVEDASAVAAAAAAAFPAG